MNDDTLILIGLGAAAILYFGNDIKKVTGGVGDVIGSVGKLSAATANAATGIVNTITTSTSRNYDNWGFATPTGLWKGYSFFNPKYASIFGGIAF